MTTMLEPIVDEALDLSDLDMLDDTRQHVFCLTCAGGTPVIGVVKEALCGARALTRSGEIFYSPPADSCLECTRVYYDPCKRCNE